MKTLFLLSFPHLPNLKALRQELNGLLSSQRGKKNSAIYSPSFGISLHPLLPVESEPQGLILLGGSVDS